MIFQIFEIDNAAMTELLNVHFDHNFDLDFCRRQILNYLKDFSIGTSSPSSKFDDEENVDDADIRHKNNDGIISTEASPISKYVSNLRILLLIISSSLLSSSIDYHHHHYLNHHHHQISFYHLNSHPRFLKMLLEIFFEILQIPF
jgi:hypothetical protein